MNSVTAPHNEIFIRGGWGRGTWQRPGVTRHGWKIEIPLSPVGSPSLSCRGYWVGCQRAPPPTTPVLLLLFYSSVVLDPTLRHTHIFLSVPPPLLIVTPAFSFSTPFLCLFTAPVVLTLLSHRFHHMRSQLNKSENCCCSEGGKKSQ